MDNTCETCGVDTWEIREYYMVHPRIWQEHGVGEGMLCVGCLEDRMDRQLNGDDFTYAPINLDPLMGRSARLRDRRESRVAA